jgi:hypothetical protein
MQREELARMFEEQQKKLVGEILHSASRPAGKRRDELEETKHKKVEKKTGIETERKCLIPVKKSLGESLNTNRVEQNSRLTVSRASETGRSLSPVVPAVAAHIRPPSILAPDYALPEDALSPAMHPLFCRLSALAKGYLTRRLLRTHKVETVIASIRDTMHTALQLHRELATSKQDVELHR